jgi:hypothetical protein
VRLGDADEPIPIADLQNPESLAAWRQKVSEYDGQPHFRIRDLNTLHDDTRFRLLELITSHPRHTVAIGPGRGVEQQNLFGAVLNAVDGGATIKQLETLRRSAVEAAALCHPAELPFACGRIAKAFRDAGISGLLPQSLVKEARALLGQVESHLAAEEAAREFVADVQSSLLESNPGVFDEVTVTGGPAVVFHADEFYRFQGTHWRKASAAEFRAQIAGFLQRSDRGQQVTRKFVGDVTANVEGMSLLPRNDLPLPLWMDAESP